MKERHWFLKNFQLFHQLPPEEISLLESRARFRKFSPKSVIYLPADAADAVIALVSGRVKICHITPDGHESIMAFIEPGEIFGELCLTEPGGRDELAIAVQPSATVVIPQAAMVEVMNRHPLIERSISRLMGLRRKKVEWRLKRLLFCSSRERLIHLLLDLAGFPAAAGGTSAARRIKITHQDLASMIGSTRETVTTALAELQTEGMVGLGRGKIELLRPAALEQSVQAEMLSRLRYQRPPQFASE